MYIALWIIAKWQLFTLLILTMAFNIEFGLLELDVFCESWVLNEEIVLSDISDFIIGFKKTCNNRKYINKRDALLSVYETHQKREHLVMALVTHASL